LTELFEKIKKVNVFWGGVCTITGRWHDALNRKIAWFPCTFSNGLVFSARWSAMQWRNAYKQAGNPNRKRLLRQATWLNRQTLSYSLLLSLLIKYFRWGCLAPPCMLRTVGGLFPSAPPPFRLSQTTVIYKSDKRLLVSYFIIYLLVRQVSAFLFYFCCCLFAYMFSSTWTANKDACIYKSMAI